jgi:hypothetical protein
MNINLTSELWKPDMKTICYHICENHPVREPAWLISFENLIPWSVILNFIFFPKELGWFSQMLGRTRTNDSHKRGENRPAGIKKLQFVLVTIFRKVVCLFVMFRCPKWWCRLPCSLYHWKARNQQGCTQMVW